MQLFSSEEVRKVEHRVSGPVFINRSRGFRHVADQFQIAPTSLRLWVMAYQQHRETSLEQSI
jgi:hypothetical protein